MARAREAILEVAVRHFAEHGYSGASLREIMRDAKVNPASAHYHFGSKEALYRDTIGPYLTRLCDERLATLERLEQGVSSSPPDARIEQLIRAYVEPHLRLCAEPGAQYYVRLLARFITENDQLTENIYADFLAGSRGRYLSALAAVAPAVPESVLVRLFSFMVSLMVTAPADTAYESLTGQSAWPGDPAELVEQIVAFVAAGFADASARYARQERSGKRKPPAKQVKSKQLPVHTKSKRSNARSS